MPRDRRDMESGLTFKGFQQTEGDHHFFVYYTADGLKSPVRTKTSHGMHEIPDNLLGQMARQCRLTRAQFLQLVDCSMDRETYEQLLRQNGGI